MVIPHYRNLAPSENDHTTTRDSMLHACIIGLDMAAPENKQQKQLSSIMHGCTQCPAGSGIFVGCGKKHEASHQDKKDGTHQQKQ